MQKFEKEIKYHEDKINDLKLKFLLSKVDTAISIDTERCVNAFSNSINAAISKHTERCVDATSKFLNCLLPIPDPVHTAGIDNSQMDIDDIEEMGAVATTSAIV
jgi:hypothetical protein